jgi:hypothetical protein
MATRHDVVVAGQTLERVKRKPGPVWRKSATRAGVFFAERRDERGGFAIPQVQVVLAGCGAFLDRVAFVIGVFARVGREHSLRDEVDV